MNKYRLEREALENAFARRLLLDYNIKEVTTQRQAKNGTREVELKVKDQATFKVTPPAGAFWTNTVHRQCTIRMCSGVNLKPANAVLEEGGFETNKDLADEGLAIRYILEGGIPEKSSADFIKEDQTSRDLKNLKNIKVNPRGKNFKNFEHNIYGFRITITQSELEVVRKLIGLNKI